MIYTSYFAQLRNFSKEITPISICAKAPEWYEGLQYKYLAPDYSTLMEYKQTHDIERYIYHYNQNVLSRNKPQDVLFDIRKMVPNGDIVLLCYEKSSDFCHRHLVRDWLNKSGIECSEWSIKNVDKNERFD